MEYQAGGTCSLQMLASSKAYWKANRRKRGQTRAIQETEAVFGPLRERINTALEALESLLVCSTSDHFLSEFLVAADSFWTIYSKQAKRAEEMAAAKRRSKRLVARSKRRRVLLLPSKMQQKEF